MNIMFSVASSDIKMIGFTNDLSVIETALMRALISGGTVHVNPVKHGIPEIE